MCNIIHGIVCTYFTPAGEEYNLNTCAVTKIIKSSLAFTRKAGFCSQFYYPTCICVVYAAGAAVQAAAPTLHARDCQQQVQMLGMFLVP